ncbi:MAG: flippase-like domain-containing protein, partial [Chloroflexi bacterium]|nr:flippase-like domain-containing protein [Chloroflexota bacterium]
MIQLTPGLLIGALSLWWAMRGLEMPAMLRTLAMASPAWITVSLVGVGAVVVVKAARWGALYRLAEPRPSFGELFAVLAAAQMINVVIPIRLGELIRIGLMKQTGQSGAITLSTLVM